MLRGENATARNLHSVVQSLESDKLKLELKVRNLEQKLRENQKPPTSSGKTSSDPVVASLLLLLTERGVIKMTESFTWQKWGPTIQRCHKSLSSWKEMA